MRLAAVLCVALFCGAGAAQSAAPPDPCPMAHADGDARYGVAYQHFLSDLHSALARNDSAPLGLLVQYPLRVNSARGTVTIPDAASLQGHLATILTPATRRQILDGKPGDTICRDEGLGLARGTLWLTAARGQWFITSINVANLSNSPRAGSMVYSCNTKTHRILISNAPKDTYLYRSWNTPKPLTGTPDLELTGGQQTGQGTGECAYSTYTFQRGNTTFAVDQGVGCTDSKVPDGVTGHLTVTIAGKVVTDTDCF